MFYVVTAMNIKIAVFWDTISCADGAEETSVSTLSLMLYSEYRSSRSTNYKTACNHQDIYFAAKPFFMVFS
jgi:hypothetical protein